MKSKVRLEVNAILDVTPVMSVIVHLIPMLMLSVRLITLAQLSTQGPPLPTRSAPDQAAYEEQQSERVAVGIRPDGFSVLGSTTGFVPCKGPCSPDTYDYAELNRALVDAKQAHPDEKRVIIAPHADAPYDVVIRTMDTARVRTGTDEVLFPDPLLAAPAP